LVYTSGVMEGQEKWWEYMNVFCKLSKSGYVLVVTEIQWDWKLLLWEQNFWQAALHTLWSRTVKAWRRRSFRYILSVRHEAGHCCVCFRKCKRKEHETASQCKQHFAYWSHGHHGLGNHFRNYAKFLPSPSPVWTFSWEGDGSTQLQLIASDNCLFKPCAF